MARIFPRETGKGTMRSMVKGAATKLTPQTVRAPTTSSQAQRVILGLTWDRLETCANDDVVPGSPVGMTRWGN